MAKEDISNKTVLVLALLVVLIVASSTWLVLNKLSEIEVKQPQQDVTVTEIVEPFPPDGGVVGLTILPRPDKGGE